MKTIIRKIGSENGITKTKPKYTLDGLLEKCDPSAPMPLDLKQWDDAKPINYEVL